MISCRRATELISKQMEEPLTILEKAELKIHLYICEYCERFKDQSELLRQTLRKLHSGGKWSKEETSGVLDSEAKQRLKEKLKEKLGSPES